MENNNEIMNVTEGAEVMNTVVSTKKIGAGEIAILGFAGAGVLATGYFAYKGFKWLFGKIKESKAAKAAQEPQEAAEAVKAEEPTAE